MRYDDELARNVRRFINMSFWMPKKNKKSPTIASLGYYTLCGDDEPGQKVFFGAKNGEQVRGNVAKHAVQMMHASEALSQDCTHNKVKMSITHNPTNSIMVPLCNSDVRTQEALEGLNGSLFVDETHVVDRAFMNRVDRMGISRDQPIVLTASTAGKNPDSYGKERYDYGIQVNEGVIHDSSHLFVDFSAPQDVTDEELAARPEHYGRLANPAWGHTIRAKEYNADYQRSRQTPARLAEFKMYRLNIWQRSASPWLKYQTWLDGCDLSGAVENLAGSVAYGGMDLSRTRDMSAFSLTIPDGEYYRLLTWFWMPEKRAEELHEKASYQQWAEDGWLELTPGDVIDYRIIENRIRGLVQKFNVVKLRYDQRFAEEITQTLEEDCNLEREAMQQSANHYAGPMDDFEGLLLEGRLKHDGNPVLSWQAGHVGTKDSPLGGRRPVKPDDNKDDHRTIDGIVASIMSLSAALSDDGGMSVYDRQDRGFIVL